MTNMITVADARRRAPFEKPSHILVSELLVDLCTVYGTDEAPPKVIPLSADDVASYVQVELTQVRTVFATLNRKWIICTGPKGVWVLDYARLRAFAGHTEASAGDRAG
jgi:hypothetical protein